MARVAGGGGRTGFVVSLRATFVLLTLAVILPFAGLLAYFGYAQNSREKGRVQQGAQTQARALAAQIEKDLTARLDGLVAAAEAVAASAGNVAAIETLARRLRQSFPDIEQVVIADSLGALLASTARTGNGLRASVGDQEWFKRTATSTQALIGEPRQAGSDIVVGLYTPARTSDGQLRAVLAADLSLKRVQDTLGRARLAGGTVAELLTDRGVVVARHPQPVVMESVQGLAGYPELLRRQDGVGEAVFRNDERRLAAVAPIRPIGWSLVVGVPSAQVLAEANSLFAQVVGAGAAAALLSLAVALSIARRTARGMDRLRTAMGRLETGDIPASVPVTTGGEVRALTEGFNRFLGWLRAKLHEYEALSQVEEAAGAAMGGDRSVGAALPELLRRVVTGMSADAGVILLQEDEGFVTKAAVGFAGISTEGVVVRRGQGLAAAVVAGREPIVVPDVDTDYRVEEPYIKAAGLRSVVGVPIASADRVLGAVEVGYRGPHNFSDAEVQRLEGMARRMARALEHERVLDEARRSTVGLEAKLAEQLAALEKAATEQAEARRQAQEARRQTEELQQTIRMQVARAPEVKEVVRVDPAAEEAKRVRADMQKTVSEELRAPLIALLELPRFLVDGLKQPLGAEERQQLEILHARGEEILELIDNLVVLSGLHGGQIKIVKAPFGLPELIQRLVRNLGARAAARGNRIGTEIDPKVRQVVSDQKRLEQVLANLLATAIKYTEVGEIRVGCTLQGAEILLTVSDDGAGFSEAEQARIFEPFLQVGPRNGRTLPATGLLLTVCQRLVQLLGGKIRVDSEVDRGTRFTVSLPVQS